MKLKIVEARYGTSGWDVTVELSEGVGNIAKGAQLTMQVVADGRLPSTREIADTFRAWRTREIGGEALVGQEIDV